MRARRVAGPPPGSVRHLLLIGTVFTSGALGTSMYLPAQPAIAATLGSDALGVQLTLTTYFVAMAIMQLLYGPLSDRFGRRPVLLGGLALYAVAGLACAVAPGIEALIALRFAHGLGAAVGAALVRAIARDHFRGDELGRTLSYLTVILSAATILSPPLGGFLTARYGWESNFVVIGTAGLVLALLVFRYLGESLREERRSSFGLFATGRNFRTLLRHRAYLGHLLAGSACFAGLYCFTANASFFAIEEFGMTPERFGVLLGLASGGYMLGAFAGARLARPLGSARVLAIGLYLFLAGGMAVMAAGWLGLVDVASLFGLACLYLIGAGLAFPQAFGGALGPFPAMAGTASSLMGFATLVSAAAGSATVSAFYDGTPLVLTSAMGLIALTGFLAHRLLIRSRARSSRSTDIGA